MNAAAASGRVLSLAAGRTLVWGPRWDCSEACLAFDANSGDFWVLTPLARQIVELLLVDGQLSDAELRSRTAGDPPHADWAATLSAVVQSGLLQEAKVVAVADRRHPIPTT